MSNRGNDKKKVLYDVEIPNTFFYVSTITHSYSYIYKYRASQQKFKNNNTNIDNTLHAAISPTC